MTSVPLVDPSIGSVAKQRVQRILSEGQLADGPEVRRFEREFAARCGAEAAIATSNGTSALHAALHAVGIGPGDRVVTTPFSFVATANAVRHSGADVIFADVDPDTYTLDPASVAALVREHDGDVDAMVPVHLYGLPADMDPLLDVADTYDLAVVEDAAQAHAASYGDRPVGTLGDVGTFSFYPTKNMTTGEGGMLVTDSDEVAARARRFVDHGRGEDGRHQDVGYNYRMTSIAAAIGRVQLDRLPQYTRLRRQHAERLTEALAPVPGIEPPTEPPGRRHVYHQYTVRCEERERVRAGLDDAGVESAVYYPRPIHHEPAYAGVEQELPVAERAAREVLSLPVHPELSTEQVDTVARAVRTLLDVRDSAIEGGTVDD